MDSRRYMSEGKNVWLSEEVDFPIDSNGCKNNVMGCEVKPIFNLESYPLISNTQALDKLDFMDLGFADDIRKSFSISSEPSGEVFSDEIGTDYLQFGEDRESGPRVSVDFNQSNQKDFSLVDLKLGRLEDGGIVKDSELSKANNVGEPSNMLSPRAKKARLTSTSIRSSCCQVLGCNKDLSSYKSYYRRHKVCDVHTKTPKVIVDGIEQRFCQQCSRFHLLGEFDDIKRSCRRRLSVHNKRRRKPHHSAEPGGGIIDFSSSLAFPSVFLGPSKHEDGFKNSTFLLQMGCVGEKVNSFSANVKDDIVGFAKPMIENLSSIQQTSCALSLLSAQSHSGSNQLLETASMTLINGSSLADLNPGHALNHSAGYCRKAASCGPHEAGIRLMEADEEGPTMISARNMQTVGLHLSSDSISSRPIIDSHQSKERGIILNLLQLSSNLQRVEQLRHSTENEAG